MYTSVKTRKKIPGESTAYCMYDAWTLPKSIHTRIHNVLISVVVWTISKCRQLQLGTHLQVMIMQL